MSGSGDVVDLILCGATGRLGNAVAHALVDGTGFGVHVAALVAPSVATTPSRSLPDGVPAFAALEEALAAAAADAVVVELTHAEPALRHIELALAAGRHAVVGSTGFADGDLERLGERFAAADLGLLHVPNFSLGAVLSMRIASELVRYFPDVEIIETHHDGKRDSPSGTARLTARRIAAARAAAGLEPGPGLATAGVDPSRGEAVEGIPVHAIRLPGATAHQEVVFGGPGELIRITHDAIDRACYAPGVARAVRGVTRRRGLETGLETVL